MVNEYTNEKLQQALIVFNKEKTDVAFRELLNVLVTTNFLTPANWDKDPVKDDKGNVIFEQDTQFQLSLIQSDTGQNFFPIFSSKEQFNRWDKEGNTHSLIMDFNQYIPFVNMAQNQIQGVVVDPFGASVLLETRLLMDMDKNRTSQVSENQIHKGDHLQLRDPIQNVTELQRALCAFGQSHDTIQSIYLKERMVKNEASHWFIIVDMTEDSKQTLQELGNACLSVNYGKGFEFMFGSMNLAKKIMEDSVPTYTKG